MKTTLTILAIAGLLLFGSCNASNSENAATISHVATVCGGCNANAVAADKSDVLGGLDAENDTVIISSMADSVSVFVGLNYDCSAPFETECKVENGNVIMSIKDACEAPPSCYDRCSCYYTFDFKFKRLGKQEEANYKYKILLVNPREAAPKIISEGNLW
jgi:hypothetical protein